MIKGIETPNSKKQVKILQYADDSNFFLQDQNSLRNVLKYFKKLKKPTGSIRNLEKTTVLHINTDNTSNVPKQIRTNKQFETVKILRILFNEDLHYANQKSMEIILEKMEKQINSPLEPYLYTGK